MTDLDVQHAALAQASSTIAEIHEDLTGAGRVLDQRARGFLGSGWQGRAADSYLAGYEEWKEGADEIIGALAQMSAMIDQADRRFGQTDQDVDGSMQRLQARLGAVRSL